jgi:hypothetical protein
MNFIYPASNSTTHILTGSLANSKNYPWSSAYNNRADYRLESGIAVSAVRENVGNNFDWSEVKVVDAAYASAEYFNKKIYVKNSDLVSINGKLRYDPIRTAENMPVQSAEDINIILKEIFIPFIDRKNALYSVRIMTDYEKALDSFLYQNLINDVLYEGVSILLNSRGLKSDNATISKLLGTYNTFAYVHDDQDKTTFRNCEPLTFTVSIPLNFFNEEQAEQISEDLPDIEKSITITNREFKPKLNSILGYLLSRAGDVEELTYPSYVIENYLTDFETAGIRRFAIVTDELLQIAGFPLNSSEEIRYQFDFDNTFNLVKVTCITKNGTKTLNRGLLGQFRMRAEFYNKRVLNYLYLYESMGRDVSSLDILDFLNKYVNYPPVRLVEESVNINGKNISGEKLKKFRQTFQEYKEKCVNPSILNDLAGDAINAYDNFADPIYHLFHKSDAAEQSKTQDSKGISEWFAKQGEDITAWRKDLSDKIGAAEKSAPDYSIKLDIQNGFKQGATAATTRFDTNINTLIYVLNRININKILFEKIFCYLKGLNPNDPKNPETAQIIAVLPTQILNYFNYIKQIKDLRGTELARAINNGTRIDPKLFCFESTEVVNLIKGLNAFIKVANLVFNLYEQMDKAIDDVEKLFTTPQVESPYLGFGRAMGESLTRSLIDLTFQFITDQLTTSCEDPRLGDYPNYTNPFGTHSPVTGYGNKDETDNAQVLNRNRRNVLDKVYSDPVQYGFDREYAVELISLLINDINCRLSPGESLQLLRGEALEEIKVVIKNIIRSKYSAPPNDLSFLLSDDNKLMLLFKELGLTVDQELLNKIEKTVANQQIPSDICGPAYDAPDGPTGNRTPDPEILDRQRRTRVLKAKNLLDQIQTGKPFPSINPFCSDLENANIENGKNHIVKNQSSLLDSTFRPIETTFNDEANEISEAFRETNMLDRRNSDGELFSSVEYDTYNRDLGLNLTNLNPILSEKKDNVRLLYRPQSILEDIEKASSLMLNTSAEDKSVSISCPDDEPIEKSKEFADFLIADKGATPKIFLEFFGNPIINPLNLLDVDPDIAADQLFDDTDNSLIGKSDLNEMWDEDNAGFDYNSKLPSHLRELDTFLAIVVDQNNLAPHDIYLKLIYNDKNAKKFKIVGESPLIKDDDLGNDIEAKIVDGYYSQHNAYDPGYVDNVYGIWTDVYDLLSIRSKNKIEGAFEEYIKKNLTVISSFKTLRDQVQKFNEVGIFNIESDLSEGKNLIKRLNFSIFDNGGNPTSKNYITVKDNFKNTNFKTLSLDIIIDNEKLLFYKYLYNQFQKRNFNYIKTSYDIQRDFVFSTIEGDLLPEWLGGVTTSEARANIIKNLEDENVAVQRNPEGTYWTEIFSQLNDLNYKQTEKFKTCRILPNYLNYDYYKKISLDQLKDDLCAGIGNLTVGVGEIAAQLFIRAAVTDYMIKGVCYWGMLTQERFAKAYTSKRYTRILEEFIKKNIDKYELGGDKLLYKEIVRLLISAYSKRTPSQEILKYTKLSSDTLIVDQELDTFRYYIIREMKHFIDYCIDKSIIKFSDKNFDETFKQLLYSNSAQSDFPGKPAIPGVTAAGGRGLLFYEKNIFDLVDAEFEYILMYILASTEIIPKQSTLFTTTKTKLLEIIGNNSDQKLQNSQDISTQTESEYGVNEFIRNLAYSPAPHAMIGLNPSYSKYVKYFIKATTNAARGQLRNIAMTSDLNVSMAVKINRLVAPVSIGLWSLMDRETRIDLIASKNTPDAEALLYKRLEDGRGLSADFVNGLAIWSTSLGIIMPTLIGWGYYAMDAIQETEYTLKSLKDIKELRGLQLNDDPCDPVAKEKTQPIDTTCSPEKKIALRKEINGYEPEEND